MFKIDNLIIMKDTNKLALIQDIKDDDVLLDTEMLFDLMKVAEMLVMGTKPDLSQIERLTTVDNIRKLNDDDILEHRGFIIRLIEAGYTLETLCGRATLPDFN